MKAVLNENNSLEIEWIPPSVDCLKISSGIWVRVSESGNQQPNTSTTEAYITVPQKCLKKRPNTSYSFILHGSSSGVNGEKRCHFQLKNDLIPCQVYNVKVVPNYQSLKGGPLSTDIFVPPTVKCIESRLLSWKLTCLLHPLCREITRQARNHWLALPLTRTR